MRAVSGESVTRSACGERFPAGAEARHVLGLFAAVRAEALTYQPCPDTKQTDLAFAVRCLIPQGLKPSLILLAVHGG